MALELSDIDDRLADVLKKVVNNRFKYTTIAAKDAEGILKQRVFSKAQAADGSSLGGYKSKAHIKKRKSKGNQTSKKDLEFTGDLRRSITTAGRKNNSEAVLGFDNKDKFEIAEHQETYLKKDIFTLSTKEIAGITERATAVIARDIDKFLSEI